MPPLLAEALGSIVRKWLTGASGILVTYMYWTNAEAEKYVAAAVPYIIAEAWAFYQRKIKNRLFKAALIMPAHSTLEQVKTKAATEPDEVEEIGTNLMKSIAIIVTIGSLLVSGCAKRAPILVASAGEAAADSIFAVSQAAEKLEKASTLPTAAALSVQETLQKMNNELKRLPEILRAIDAAQVASQPYASELDKAIAILTALQEYNSIVVAGVPLNEITKPLLSLVQAASQVITTTLLQLAKLREPPSDVVLIDVDGAWMTPAEAY